jgi:hypothetical protein
MQRGKKEKKKKERENENSPVLETNRNIKKPFFVSFRYLSLAFECFKNIPIMPVLVKISYTGHSINRKSKAAKFRR